LSDQYKQSASIQSFCRSNIFNSRISGFLGHSDAGRFSLGGDSRFTIHEWFLWSCSDLNKAWRIYHNRNIVLLLLVRRVPQHIRGQYMEQLLIAPQIQVAFKDIWRLTRINGKETDRGARRQWGVKIFRHCIRNAMSWYCERLKIRTRWLQVALSPSVCLCIRDAVKCLRNVLSLKQPKLLKQLL
jgi:hypothetical protein